jgi:hypothetical protein
MRRPALSIGGPVAALTAALILFAPTALAATIVLVSGPSPYASCPDGGAGTNFLNAEVEPWVSVNPGNGSNIAGVFQQDRWSTGGAHGLVAASSFNGGSTWTETTLPFDVCAPSGLSFERASDPWISFGPDGTAYTVSISFNRTNNDNSVAAATSADGGKNWHNLNIIDENIGTTQFFDDKESVTADPTTPGTAYVVWDTLQSPNANPQADHHAVAFTGPARFSKTTDGGKHWSTPVAIFSPGQNNQTIGNQIVADPRTGTLYNFLNWINHTGTNQGGNPNGAHGSNVAVQKSTDKGAHWTQPLIISPLLTVGVVDPNTGQTVRSGDIVPEPAIDPASGTLYVTWQDSRFTGGQFDQVALSRSTDGGAHWSTPIRVNTPTGRPAFNPAINVSSNGTVGVTYMDFRNLATGNTTSLPTDAWLTRSTDAGATFDSEVHVFGSFDMFTAPNAEGFFVGDYQGLATTATTFHPFFAATNSGNLANRTDIFTTSL